MKNFHLMLAATLSLFLFVASAGAATVSISPTGDYAMAAGDTVSFDVLFTADADGDTLESVTLNLGYDAAELSFDSYSYDTLTAAGWGEYFGTVDDTGSALANYNVSVFLGSGIAVGANESISMGTFTFTATNGLLADGLEDLWVIDSLGGYNSKVVFNGNEGEFVSTLITDQGAADVAPVPVPGAVWLLGSGLIGMLGLRRRKA
jgi:hypothetical protein